MDALHASGATHPISKDRFSRCKGNSSEIPTSEKIIQNTSTCFVLPFFLSISILVSCSNHLHTISSVLNNDELIATLTKRKNKFFKSNDCINANEHHVSNKYKSKMMMALFFLPVEKVPIPLVCSLFHCVFTLSQQTRSHTYMCCMNTNAMNN